MTIIDSAEAIAAQQDPQGKVWKVVPHPPTNLYHFVIVKEDGELRRPQSIPTSLSGLFTNINRATAALNAHLQAVWKHSDAKAAKAELRAKNTQIQEEREKLAKDAAKIEAVTSKVEGSKKKPKETKAA